MASIVNKAEEKESPEDEAATAPEAPALKPVDYRSPGAAVVAKPPDTRGFFHIHKRGQGYWTRMGTAGGAALIGLLTAFKLLYEQLPTWGVTKNVTMIVIGVFLVVYSIFIFWL